MSSSYRALCNDSYINSRISVRMELPSAREPVLELFERMRRTYPGMSAFRRYKDELALESGPDASPHRWLAIRNASVRAGVVNPSNETEAYALHRTVAEVSPYYLSISPLDLESIELLYGFDLSAKGNHDEIAASALLAGSPLAALMDNTGAGVKECQPTIGFKLDDPSLEATFEIKTRSTEKHTPSDGEPISVYLMLKKSDPVTDLRDLPNQIDALVEHGQSLVDDFVVPNLLVPLRDEISSRSF